MGLQQAVGIPWSHALLVTGIKPNKSCLCFKSGENMLLLMLHWCGGGWPFSGWTLGAGVFMNLSTWSYAFENCSQCTQLCRKCCWTLEQWSCLSTSPSHGMCIYCSSLLVSSSMDTSIVDAWVTIFPFPSHAVTIPSPPISWCISLAFTLLFVLYDFIFQRLSLVRWTHGQ